MSEKRLEKITKVVENRQKDLIVVLENIYDPHNAAAILRSCDAFGVQQVYFIFNTVESYNPKKVGKVSSSSANKWLDFKTFKSTENCFTELHENGYKIFLTILDDKAKNLYDVDFKKEKLALVIGNEHAGVSPEAIELADQNIYIPMQGMVQSLNVSVTAGICLSEMFRQRLPKTNKYLFNKKNQQELVDDFLQR